MKQTARQTSVIKHLLGAAVAISRTGIIVIDESGRTLAVNARALQLLHCKGRMESFIGLSANKLFSRVGELRKQLQVLVQKHRPFKLTSCFIEGKNANTYVTASAQVVAGGSVIFIDDVTSSYDEVNKLKTEFVSMASHQLRTPLTAVRWYLEEVLEVEMGKLSKVQREYITCALESVGHMITLVRNLLNISRLEAQRITIDPKLIDMIKLAGGIIHDHAYIARAKNCRIVLHTHGRKALKISVDDTLIVQVFANLIANAINYSGSRPGGTTIHVIIEVKKPDVVVRVEDGGVGIPKRFQNRIFDKFFRADNVVKISADGTGLGLYIAKLIVESSGGNIWFESPVKSRYVQPTNDFPGTAFVFTLPLSGSKPRKSDREFA